MLNDLSIKNFAIIDELHLSFSEGLNVISGETGAGKSIIIGAVSLLLGDRAATEMIRSQADTATVEAVFDISDNKPLQDRVAAMGFPEAEELIIRRVISHAGKNRAFINGQSATLTNLSAISELLINICGQHEHQVILNAENHIDILDEFGDCLIQRTDYEEIYNRYQQTKSEIDRLRNLSRSREEKADLYKFQLKEIQDIHPQPAEDTTLADEKKVLVNAQKLTDCANRAYDLLYGEKDCAMVKLKEVENQIKEIKKIDASLNIADADMEGSVIAFQEAALTLRDYMKNIYFDESRLAAIDDRLELLNRLKRKHGGTLDAVLNKKQEIEESLKTVFSLEEELEKLNREKDKIKEDLNQSGGKLSQQRQESAKKLEDAVDREIRALNMPHASFYVNFRKAADDVSESFGPK
ncbi:MAG: AAA family ATPase, partial [Smithella sp.]